MITSYFWNVGVILSGTELDLSDHSGTSGFMHLFVGK